MQKLSSSIERKASVITKKENLEHLYTFKDFPVFFGCTSSPASDDLFADMNWSIDPLTGIIQLTNLIPLEILYMDQHVDATGSTWQKYYSAFSEYVLKNKNGNILEIGGGSGKLANLIIDNDKNISYTVVEPNPTFQEKENLKVIKSFFSGQLKKYFNNDNTVVFSQVYEHMYDPEEFLVEIGEFLPIGGKLVFAYPNLEYWFKHKFTNAINFEHTILLTDYYVDYFLKKSGFRITEKIDYEHHSHFYTAEKIGVKKKMDYTELENRYLHYKGMFVDFIAYHEELVKAINSSLNEIDSGVYLFGAHIFSQYLFAFGLNTSNVINILDNSPLKQGKRLYGSSLMVESPKVLAGIDNPYIILKAGLYNKEIMEDIITNINPTAKFI